MAATSIGVQFDIVDLDASYEVVGTSDNYSFQYDLGRGSDLVNFEGESFQKVISLKGNYGNFEIRVFAVSDIGVRSEFIQDEISISAPEFDNTFTFSNLRVEDTENNLSLDSYNVYSPKEQGDKLIVNSEFLNKKINLKWELIPPGGHAKEGESLSRELFGDTFLDHFEIRIRRGEGGTLVTESEINNSLSLAASLNASTPYDLLTNYKSFEIEINQAAFDELNLERTNSFEIVSYDSFGRTATGLLTGINYYPSLDNFIYDLNSSSLSMSWSSVDKDVSSVDLSGIAIPSSEQLYAVDNIADNVEYYSSLNDAPIWTSINNKIYKLGDKVLYTDDYVYECILEHTASLNSNPTSQSHWRQLNKKIDYFYFERQPDQNNFQIKQIFGYSYYYGIQASDGFGTGINYNITQDGLSDGGELRGFASSISLKNLRYRERGEDLIFNWDVVDQDDNAVDISQNKFIFTESDVPSLLGISGSLYDLKTNQYLTGITQGNNSSSAILDPALNKVKIDGLHNAGVFYAYEYTRAINNSIYGVGGFPANIVDYDSSVTYNLSSTPNSVIAGGDQLFEIKNDNSIISPNIAPYYDDWSSSVTYDQNDVVKYNSVLYVVDAKFGIESDDIVEFFNENNSYTAGQLVVFVDQTVPVFNPEAGYFEHNLVLYNGEIYKSLQDQNEGSAAIPGQDANSWKVATILVDYGAAIYKCLNNVFPPASVSPIQDVDNWQIQNPSSSDHFSVYVQAYSDEVQYSIGDLVFYDDIVYVAQTININSLPVTAETNATYVDWLPIWERNTSYDDIIFQHIGIPEGGKRSIGIEIGILDNNGEIIESKRLDADNPPPVISSAGFFEKIDTTSEVTKVKFNFNYLLDHQEKTSRVNVYRIPEHEVEQYDAGGNVIGYDFGKFVITGEDGSPDTSEYLVQTILGASNDTYGDNINKIIDEPPIPFDENGVDQITGYYYKILPFDDFGSGELYTVPNGDPLTSVEDKIVVYPKRFNDNNPYSAPGKVVRPDSTSDNIPGPVKNFNGNVAFENFFLNWTAPNQDYDPDVPNKLLDWTENDIDYYEVWNSREQTIKTGDNSVEWSPDKNTGYRKIEGTLYSVGEKPKEIKDPARNIVNAENIFNVPANAPSIEVVHKGSTDIREYFWVRAVDFAGNKSPFTGSSDNYIDGIEGLSLTPGTISATDVGDFEISITDKFTNTIALNPNNPFFTSAGFGKWSDHSVFYQGQSYPISGSIDNHIRYSTDGLRDGYVWWQTNNDYYNTGIEHPASLQDGNFNDGDFIIARVNEGIVTPAFHVFANALIGTANIAEAAIIDAKIKDLSADKITAGKIKGHRLEIINSGSDQSTYGSLASKGFSGIRNENISGFVLSGDGSFAFQQGGSSLTFDDEGLVLRGKLQQKNGLDFDFIDINLSPNYFNYLETDIGTYQFEEGQVVNVSVEFRNSSITSIDQIQIRLDVTNAGVVQEGSWAQVSTYNEFDSVEFIDNILSFDLSVEEFNNQIQQGNSVDDALIVNVRSTKGSLQRSATITRIIDGKTGVDSKTVKIVSIKKEESEQIPLYDSSKAYDYLDLVLYEGDTPEIYLSQRNQTAGQSTPGSDEDFWSLVTGIRFAVVKGQDGKYADVRPMGFSAETQGIDNPSFRWTVIGSYTSIHSQPNYILSSGRFPSLNQTVTLEVVAIDSDGNHVATDNVTIYCVKEGSDALTAFLTNAVHVVQSDSSGNTGSAALDNAGGQFKVFLGSQDISNQCEFSVATQNGISMGIGSASGTYSVNSFNADADQGSATLEATIPIIEGKTNETKNIDLVYSISKAMQGETPSVYYLLAKAGTLLHNGQGFLPIQAREVVGGEDRNVSFNVDFYKLSSDANGNYILEEKINDIPDPDGLITILKNDVNGVLNLGFTRSNDDQILDTITIADVTDGIDTIVGSVESNKPLVYVKDKNSGSWSSTSDSTLTAKFYRSGSFLGEKTATVVLNSTAGTLSSTGGTDITVSGNNSSSITITFTQQDGGDSFSVSETVYAVQGGDKGDKGDSPSVYYIKPTDGTALKNSSGSLEVEARQIIDGVDSKISSGNIKLYVGTSDKGYDETFNASQINGSVLVELKEGSTVYDTITLIDVTDGEDAIVGSVTSNRSLAYVQNKNDGSWSTTDPSSLTAKFYKNGSVLNTKTTTVVLNSTAGTLSYTGGTDITVSGNNSSAITITFTYNNVSVSETVYAVLGGDKGDPGNLGSSPSFRGVWNPETQYIGEISTSPTTPARGDVVYHEPSSKYYICKKNASGNNQSPTNDTFWETFGNQFSSVATELLLTKDAFITQKLELGVGGNATKNPQSGVIVSAGFTGGLYDVYNDTYLQEDGVVYKKKLNCAYYATDFENNGKMFIRNSVGALQELPVARRIQWDNNTIELTQSEYDNLPPLHRYVERIETSLTRYMYLGKDQFIKKDSSWYSNAPGFLLARPDDDRAIFDVGGTGQLGNDSYIRFDSSKGKVEIAGSFINNTILAPDFNVADLQFLEDPFGAFVGGGYNNFIGIDESSDFNSLGSAITAGAWNTMESRFSFIGAGYSGDCRDNFSAIVAGYGNSMPLEEPESNQGSNFIGAGIVNTISGGASQSIINGSNNLIEGKTGVYQPLFDEDNSWFSKYILGMGDNSLTEIEGAPNWYASWLGYFAVPDDAQSLRGIARGGRIRSLKLGWLYVAPNLAFSYLDEPIQGLWIYTDDFNSSTKGWYWFYRESQSSLEIFGEGNKDYIFAYFNGNSSINPSWVYINQDAKGYFYEDSNPSLINLL